MKIGGLQRFSLSDFPGRVAGVIFTQGCNFRCPFCHNGVLIPARRAAAELVPEETVLEFLKRRAGRLEGVVISGGEPTLQPDLPRFLDRVKRLGFAVKLDTNGSRPEVLRRILRDGLLDFIAMDIKAPLALYSRLAGVTVRTGKIEESIALIAESGVAHEFRTTAVEALLDPADLRAVQALVPAGSPHRWQRFESRHALDPALRDRGDVSEQAGAEVVAITTK